MPFVKLDTGILDSTLWVDRDSRDMFITALLLAKPRVIMAPMPQLEIRSLNETGFVVPLGEYGFIEAAGVGIARRALVEPEKGLDALIKLGLPDGESRSSEFEGRRLVRVNGGFVVLNYMKYRDKDHTAAQRQRDLRQRNGVMPRNVTQAEAEAETEKPKSKSPRKLATTIPDNFQISERVRRWADEHGGVPYLAEHFESFVEKCKAKGYRYVDWDAALMTAIRNDWAGITKQGQKDAWKVNY